MIAVAGESTGGNLACNVSIMARDKGVMMPAHSCIGFINRGRRLCCNPITISKPKFFGVVSVGRQIGKEFTGRR